GSFASASRFFSQAEDGIRDRNVTGVQTCALPISGSAAAISRLFPLSVCQGQGELFQLLLCLGCRGDVRQLIQALQPEAPQEIGRDRKSTRLNSSHVSISYAVFCLHKKRASGYLST